MDAAVRNGIAGIEAECGGGCVCATCHVYIDGDDAAAFPARDEEEDGMLEFVSAERRATSRLSCQLKVEDAPDGLVVHLPESQL